MEIAVCDDNTLFLKEIEEQSQQPACECYGGSQEAVYF